MYRFFVVSCMHAIVFSIALHEIMRVQQENVGGRGGVAKGEVQEETAALR